MRTCAHVVGSSFRNLTVEIQAFHSLAWIVRYVLDKLRIDCAMVYVVRLVFLCQGVKALFALKYLFLLDQDHPVSDYFSRLSTLFLS